MDLSIRSNSVIFATEKASLSAWISDDPELYVVNIQGFQIVDELTLMRELAKAAKFPDYFGHNWDALYDCLTDPNDDITKHLFVYRDARPLIDSSLLDFLKLLRVFADAAQYRRSHAQEVLLIVIDDYAFELASDVANIVTFAD